MLHPSTQKLITRLAEMTERGRIDWAETEMGSVSYTTEGYTVSLGEAPDEFVITSRDGKELERATTEDLAVTQDESGASYTEIISTMKREAGRVARGTEAAISALLAGMEAPSLSAVPEPSDETTETQADIPPAEDIVDETTAVASMDVEDTQDEPEVSLDEAENIDQPADEPVLATAETEDTAQEEVSLETLEVDEAAETESDVTEAVAQLADEVNALDEATEEAPEGALTVAAAGLATSVAAAETLHSAVEEAEPETVEQTALPEAIDADLEITVEPVEVEAASAMHSDDEVSAETPEVEAEPSVTSSVEAQPYVPFGLEDDAPQDDSTPLTEASASVLETEAVTDFEESTPAAVAEGIETEANTEVEEEEPSETVEVTIEEVADEPAELSHEAVEVVTATSEPEEPTVDSQAVEASSEGPVQSYSLSGLSAGFGLGTLSSTTEATGVPEADPAPAYAVPAEAEDKIIIDATDDIPPPLEETIEEQAIEEEIAAVSTLSFPEEETAAPEPVVQTAAETVTPEVPSENSDDEDDSLLKPRTRFNPWD